MRNLLALVSATLLTSALAAADPISLPPPLESLRSFYPQAALDRSESGSVILRCGRTEHGGYTDCQVVYEAPSGLGFGDAAVKLAAKAADCPTLTLPSSERVALVSFRFSAVSASIAPDLLKPSWPVTQGRWLRLPTGEDMAEAYPSHAARDRRNGHATLACLVDKAGGIHGCVVAGEAPAGYDFGAADLKLLPRFGILPSTDCAGEPIESTVVIPIRWVMPLG